LYQTPPDDCRVICLDELGPVSAKIYPGKRWASKSKRPPLQPDYKKYGYLWVFGAFEPSTGQAVTLCRAQRNSLSFIALLDAVAKQWPSGELILILDNLSIHRSMSVQLWALAHKRVRFLFQPTYAPWLNLIEPWWKTLKSLALNGRSFKSVDSLRSSIVKSTNYWNSHCHPYVWRKCYSS
jgi:transposase